MSTLYSLIKKLAALLRDLFCLVLAWLLVWSGDLTSWISDDGMRQGWLRASHYLYKWSYVVQGWAPLLSSPYQPATVTQESKDD